MKQGRQSAVACESRVACLLLVSWLLLALAGNPAGAASFEDHARIRDAAERAVRAQLADEPGQLVVEAQALDPRLLMPACEQPLQASAPRGMQGRARVTVEVSCMGQRAWRVYVPVGIRLRRMVVVTAQPLERGKVLAPGDVILAERELAELGSGYLTSLDAANGQVLRRAVPAGAPLSAGLLEAPILVRRGQPVTLQARSGALSVQAPAVARGDGVLGALIEVQNVSSKKIVQAVVINEQTVEIRLP